MSVIIRQGAATDFHAVFSLIQAFSQFQKTPEKVINSPAQMIADQHLFKCLVAETMTGEIVGFASYFFAYYSWSGKALYLDDLYVRESFRGNGLGKNLLEAVIILAKMENCKKLRWQVSDWNENAIRFYQKMGAVNNTTEINCEIQIGS